MDQTARCLRQELQELKEALARLERQDWPRWLREADETTRRITELGRQASELERAGGTQAS